MQGFATFTARGTGSTRLMRQHRISLNCCPARASYPRTLRASAALYRRFWRRDETLTAMLPQETRRRDTSPAERSVVQKVGSRGLRFPVRRENTRNDRSVGGFTALPASASR